MMYRRLFGVPDVITDIKIDILEAYVWTSEVFRVKSGFFWSTGRLPEPPGNLMGLNVPSGGRGEEA